MIDCHAHAFPDLAHHTEGLPAPVGDFVRRSIVPYAQGLLERLREPMRALPALNLEQVAELRMHAPAALGNAAERLASYALTPQTRLFGTVEDLIASMDRNGVDRSVVIGAGHAAGNEWLLDRVRDSRRLLPVATLPDLPAEAGEGRWHDSWDALARAGARGFKIHPNMDGLPAGHPAYRALFEVAQAHGRFVILHTGCFAAAVYRHHEPADAAAFTALFESYPNVRVCLAHMNRDQPERAWELLARFPQLYTDTSWQPTATIRRALERVGAGRLLLGSDWPLLHTELQRDAIAQLRGAARGEELEQIVTVNARRFLGESPPG
jgi:predicted TIM-barrel fold metal-dependent hydrolase